jgi:hypothetical protein
MKRPIVLQLTTLLFPPAATRTASTLSVSPESKLNVTQPDAPRAAVAHLLFPVNVHRTPPTSLSHYTDAARLYGIVRSGCLWAPHMYYLSDSQEFTYASQLLNSAFGQRVNNSRDQVAERLYQLQKCYQDRFAVWKSIADPYVVCFCEAGNLLSQWRAYAANGSGFALEFEPERLMEALQSDPEVDDLLSRIRRTEMQPICNRRAMPSIWRYWGVPSLASFAKYGSRDARPYPVADPDCRRWQSKAIRADGKPRISFVLGIWASAAFTIRWTGAAIRSISSCWQTKGSLWLSMRVVSYPGSWALALPVRGAFPPLPAKRLTKTVRFQGLQLVDDVMPPKEIVRAIRRIVIAHQIRDQLSLDSLHEGIDDGLERGCRFHAENAT